ncbi:DedA family protein [Halodurantibacterium flavum]|uniref:DedA family protein n=1 Tax=Halodurantibacterium flavum TaxID=1382802 RepID=A0ABW4S856_9RHOB
MEQLIERFMDAPLVLAALLFAGTFILEEAAIVTGAALAAAQDLSAPLAFAALSLGLIVSDWVLYAIGAAAARIGWFRQKLGEENIARGRDLLARGVWPAGLTARLVPWLLFPVFVASGFLGVGFLRFALANAAIGIAYLAILFFGIYGFNLVLFDWLAGWGWVGVIGLAAALMALTRWVGYRYRRTHPASPSAQPNASSSKDVDVQGRK